MYNSKKFQMFDYGSSEQNKKHYGTVSILKYNIIIQGILQSDFFGLNRQIPSN